MIDFVSCSNGKLELPAIVDGKAMVCKSADPVELAEFVKSVGGFADVLMGSSSMDFASEEGFDTDDCASLLLKRVLELV